VTQPDHGDHLHVPHARPWMFRWDPPGRGESFGWAEQAESRPAYGFEVSRRPLGWRVFFMEGGMPYSRRPVRRFLRWRAARGAIERYMTEQARFHGGA
jgi:hypothetical protein